MNESNPHRREREKLTRQVDLTNQCAIDHHGPRAVTKPFREEVNNDHAREQINSVVVHTPFKAQEKAHRNIEHSELDTRLNVRP